jgi:hypothetical protein
MGCTRVPITTLGPSEQAVPLPDFVELADHASQR